MKILDWKNIIIEAKNSLEGSIIDLTGRKKNQGILRKIGILCNPKDRENEEKQSLRAIQGLNKYTNICNRVTEGEEKGQKN